MQLSLSKKESITLNIGFALLLVLVILNKRSPFYDEVLYLRDVSMLHKYGFGNKFLLALTGSAGPLYAVIHFLLEPLTHLQPPYFRLVNIGFLFGMLFFLNRTLPLLGCTVRNYSLYCFAIPMTYVVAGLALTEMPAMFFLSAGLYLALLSIIAPVSIYRQLFYLVAGGICLSIAITGRQPFMVILAALPILFLSPFKKENLIKLIVLLIFSVALPAYVFWVWQGLVPPTDAMLYDQIAKEGTSYRPDFFFLCIAYFAVVFLIIAPGFYRTITKKTWIAFIAGYILLIVINYWMQVVVYLPFLSVTGKVFQSAQAQLLAGIFFGAALMVIACYFLFSLAWHAYRAEGQRYFLFYASAMLLVAVSCTKITWGFSSRYAAQAIPLLIPVMSYFRTPRKQLYAVIVGVILGVTSLLLYIIT